MGRNTAVLHLLPHSGGGVGSVLRALLSAQVRENTTSIPYVASLEHLNETTRHYFDTLGIHWVDCVAMKGGFEKFSALVQQADIVLTHWWNHPLLMRLLFQGLPPSRLALWSHVNGFAAPQSFFPELFEFPDRFVFATKASWQSPVVQDLDPEIMRKLRVIRSCAGIPADAVQSFIKDGPFQYGYVGTVEPAKMHPDFLELCAAANIPSRCIVAGGPAHDELRFKAEYLGIGNHFDILGPVDDPGPIFRRLHAFAYPLNPAHYGSGEQVLVEAMAYGAVPVVFDNLPEKALIRHNETGIITHTAEEFTNALRFLADNPADRKRFAAAGRQFVFDECDINVSMTDFYALFEEMLSLPKCPHRLNLPSFDGVGDGSPFHLFLASCGSDTTRSYFNKMGMNSGISALPTEFTSITRGTPQHYLRLLGHDPSLERICNRYHSEAGATP
jgi:glycosyltransferase involved in cell wall biosynthesis